MITFGNKTNISNTFRAIKKLLIFFGSQIFLYEIFNSCVFRIEIMKISIVFEVSHKLLVFVSSERKLLSFWRRKNSDKKILKIFYYKNLIFSDFSLL